MLVFKLQRSLNHQSAMAPYLARHVGQDHLGESEVTWGSDDRRCHKSGVRDVNHA